MSAIYGRGVKKNSGVSSRRDEKIIGLDGHDGGEKLFDILKDKHGLSFSGPTSPIHHRSKVFSALL